MILLFPQVQTFTVQRRFLFKTLPRTIIFQRYFRTYNASERYPSAYFSVFSPNEGKGRPEWLRIRTLFTHCKPATVKEREKNAKKITLKNVLNNQKYHEILPNAKILHAQSKLQILPQKDHLKVIKAKMIFLS